MLLRAVADELARGGITLIDSTRYIPEYLATPGVMTRRQPAAEQLADIEFGFPLLLRVNELDVGQAMAVRDREVLAIEAIEGTDAMIRCAGELCRIGGWTLLKAGKANQDMVVSGRGRERGALTSRERERVVFARPVKAAPSRLKFRPIIPHQPQDRGCLFQGGVAAAQRQPARRLLLGLSI